MTTKPIITNCPHTDRPYRSLGMCNACYLKQNGGSKRWYAKNRQLAIERTSTWVAGNRERRRANASRWQLKDEKLHPEKHALKERIRVALKGIAKAGKTVELLGCSIKELRVYIESKFKEGMSWDNYGRYGWHIDHIRPCSSFNLSDPVQQRECFHHTNLQPLWWIDNLKKGATIV